MTLGASCQVCGESVKQGEDVVRCARCSTVHHAACFRFAGRCSGYGCSSLMAEAAPQTEPTPTPRRLGRGGALLSPLPWANVENADVAGVLVLCAAAPLWCLVVIDGRLSWEWLGGARHAELVGAVMNVVACIALVAVWPLFMSLPALLRTRALQGIRPSDDGRWLHRDVTLLGRRLVDQPTWVDLASIAEVHVHAMADPVLRPKSSSTLELLLVGERRVNVDVADPAGTAHDAGYLRLLAHAEALATLARCTIRRYDPGQSPPVADVRAAIEGRVAELATGWRPEALEAAPAPVKG